MKFDKVHTASFVLLVALLTVPSFAFPNGSGSSCYSANLSTGETEYGSAMLRIANNKAQLELEINGFPQSGDFEVALFKDYYSDFIAGTIELIDGEGKATFDIPFLDADFQVIIDTDPQLRSTEWVECEPSVKPDTIKVSPTTLNLKSMGNWITITLRVSTDPMPTDFSLSVGESGSIEPLSVKVTGDHISLKFSREELQSLCSPGNNMVTLSFKIGEDNQVLSDVIKVINPGDNGNQATAQENNQDKSNNGKAKGKNKSK